MRFRRLIPPLLAALLVLLPAAAAQSAVGKRGHAVRLADQAAPLRTFAGAAGWWHSYSAAPADPAALAAGAAAAPPFEFVAMQRALNNITDLDAILAALVAQQPVQVLLGYDEPDRAERANIMPTPAARNWYLLERAAAKYGLRLGSPAMGNYPPWMDVWSTQCDAWYCIESQFGGTGKTCQAAGTLGADSCKKCKGLPFGRRGCRVDFVAAHVFQCNFTKFASDLDARTTKYGLPVWVTEFGCLPGSEIPVFPYPVAQSYDPMVAYIKQLITYLDSRPDVERYAWFTHRASASDGSYVYHQLYGTAQYDLSPVGETYKTFGLGGNTTVAPPPPTLAAQSTTQPAPTLAAPTTALLPPTPTKLPPSTTAPRPTSTTAAIIKATTSRTQTRSSSTRTKSSTSRSQTASRTATAPHASSTTRTATTAAPAPPPPPPPPPGTSFSKRGHGIWLADQNAVLRNFTGQASWWYSWDVMPYNWQTPNPVLFGASANPPWEYVPMQWSPANIASLDANLATLSTRQTTRVLLGWNEPDRADQANISPAVGAQQWYLLERAAAKYGLRLGGPAIGSSPPWLDSWYTECDKYYCIEASFGGTGTTCQAASTLGASVCKQCAGKPYGQRGCRVDFNPVHIYNCDFTKFVAELDKRTVKYGQPVWVTEFGCMPTWEWPAYPYPLAQGYAPMTAYAQQLLAYLDGRADIERYAWWTHQAASADGAYIYHQLYSSHFQLSPVGNVYKTYGISPATPVTTATATTQTPVMATTVTFAAPTSSPLPSGASLTTAWNASLARCSFNQSIGGLGEPLDARACANPVVDAMPGQRTSYDGPFRPSCDLRWWGASQACGALTRAARTVFIGDSLTKHVHDELHALLREDAELGYMSPLTPSTINATCRCQSPYLMENNQQCKNYAQSSMGRNKTEHWYSPTVWKYWYTSDICAKRSLVDYFGMFTDWTTDTASMNIMADLETVIQQASSSVVVVVGGTPPYSQLGTGAYNAAYNCDNVLKPIAALFAKYGIPYSRLVVLGMHRIEQKTWVDGNNAPVEAFNSGWQACAGANAPGSAFVDSYGLSTAGSASYTEDGLHGGVRINMLKVQVVLQQVGAM